MMIKKYNIMIKPILFLLVVLNFLFSADMTAPAIPELKAIAWDGIIILTWDKTAEESLDSNTGYADFEGYRLYKSTDGGQTWGQPIPLNGKVAGYQPIFQTDLTEAQDTTRCVYSNSYYSNSNQCEERDVEISGPDPVAPWFNLGDNSFLEHSYYDYDVINGVEYTYAITAYDMGVRIGNTEYINCTYIDPEDNQPYTESECEAIINQNTEDLYCVWNEGAENPCDWITPPENDSETIIDTSWKRTGNPGKFTCPDGWMCPSFESPKSSESFTDYNANGLRDIIEDYVDSNSNGQYDIAEDFSDTNNNGQWDDFLCQNPNLDTYEECVNTYYCTDDNFSDEINCLDLKECYDPTWGNDHADYTDEELCEDAGQCINDYNEIVEEYKIPMDQQTCLDLGYTFIGDPDDLDGDDCIGDIVDDIDSDIVIIDEATCDSYDEDTWWGMDQQTCLDLGYTFTDEDDCIGDIVDDIDSDIVIIDEATCDSFGDLYDENTLWLNDDCYYLYIDCYYLYGYQIIPITDEGSCEGAPLGCIDNVGNIIIGYDNHLDCENDNYVWQSFEWEYYEWLSVNDWLVYVWLEPEDYIDSNDNGQYDISEIFTDLNGNGIWDATNEPFLDCGFIDCVTFEGELICEYDDQWGQAWIDEIVESIWVCEGDEIWNDLVGNGTWDSNREYAINIITIVPSVNAIDVTFPTDDTVDEFFIPDLLNVGTGAPGREIFLKLVDESDLEPYIVKMEIQAEGDDDDFEGFKSRNPLLYVWRIDSTESQNLIPGYYASYTVSSLSEEEINNYLDMPGTTYSEDEVDIYVPTYEIDPHTIMFSDELGAESNYTQWFSGIQLRFDNYWFELPQTNSFAGIADVDFMNFNSVDSTTTDLIYDYFDENGFISDENYDNITETLPWLLGLFDTPGEWWNNSGGDISLSYWGGSFDSRPMFDYRIDFSSTAYPDTAYRVFPSSSEDYCIDVSLTNESWDGNKDEVSFLPMKVTNLATGRQVRSWHNDKGIYTADGSPVSDDPGYGDCTWNPNETLSFTHDSLAFSDDLDDIDDEKSFELVINYTIYGMRLKYGADYFEGFEQWSDNIDTEYSITTIVEYAETLWEAEEQINESTIYPANCDGPCPPSLVYDIDGDNINDNPWKQLYPWRDGDYIIVTPDKWYQDGDNWVANLSLLGSEDPSLLTQEALDSIYVNPNPYIVNSVFNEDTHGNRLIFDKLPKQCTISIYTITGELVEVIDHGDENNLDGFHHWDLRNQNGDIVVPGLYIFVVEAGHGLDPRIGKFVIIK